MVLVGLGERVLSGEVDRRDAERGIEEEGGEVG